MHLAGLAPAPQMATVPRHRPAAAARMVEDDGGAPFPYSRGSLRRRSGGRRTRRCLLRGLHFSRSQFCTGRSVRSWLGGVQGPAASVRHARSPLGPAAPSRQKPACSRFPPRPKPRGTGGGGLAFTGPLPSREKLIN